MTSKSELQKKDDVTTIEQFSFLDSYLGKEVSLTLTNGRPMHCKIIKISAYELLVEEGTRMNKPIEKLIFKQAVASLEDRRER